MTSPELHSRLAMLITRADEMAAAFMQLDLEIRLLARAAFVDPATAAAEAEATAEATARKVEAELGQRLPRIRRSA